MRGVEDTGQLERERGRRRLLLLRAGRGDAAQHQQHRPVLKVVRSKYDDRVVGKLTIGHGAVGLIASRCKIIPQRVCSSDDRFIALNPAVLVQTRLIWISFF